METQAQIDREAEGITDGAQTYFLLKDTFAKLTPYHLTQLQISADRLPPWIHVMISNAKRWFLGIYHRMSDTYLQNYLNEFCYKQNRPYFKESLFDRLVSAPVSHHWKP